MDRVVVVGGPGSGKTTTARALAEQIGAGYIEVDARWWEPGWHHVDAPELRRRVRAAIAAEHPRWVLDGSYVEELAEALWPEADTLVWMTVPRHTAIRRAVLRSVRRARSGQLLWGTNRESWSNLTLRSVVRLWNRWPEYDLRIEAALSQPWAGHLEVIRASSPVEAAPRLR